MIWFDTTKSARSGHHSGLIRVSTRLQTALGAAARAVTGPDWQADAQRTDWFLTAEIFTPEERPGWTELLAHRPCRLGAIFHDAIPLQLPQITWPQSVRRHPGYLKMLARFDRIWAVSEASRRDLLGYWAWLGVAEPPPVDVLALGADYDGTPRTTSRPASSGASLVCVGILEPRKNQMLLLDVCDELWAEGRRFDLHLVGRVNPHFGRPVQERIKQLGRTRPGLHHGATVGDQALGELYAGARAAVFPTRAEGCGLPVVEALWRGLLCVCSDLPALREHAAGGGCATVPVNDPAAWRDALRRILTDDAWCDQLAAAAVARPLKTWRETADALRRALET
ncbi:MAG: glycosyltransferase [Opitutales bacterium]